MVLFPELTYLTSQQEAFKDFQDRIQQLREKMFWPEYFQLASVYRLFHPSFKLEHFSDDELNDMDEDFPDGELLFEIFEDARIAGSDAIEYILDFSESKAGVDITSNEKVLKLWTDEKRIKFEIFSAEVFENEYEMFRFTECIRRYSVIEADEVKVSEKGIQLVYKTSLIGDRTPDLPETRRY